MFDQLDHSPAANSTIIPGRRYRPHHTLTQYASRRTQYEYLVANAAKQSLSTIRNRRLESPERCLSVSDSPRGLRGPPYFHRFQLIGEFHSKFESCSLCDLNFRFFVQSDYKIFAFAEKFLFARFEGKASVGFFSNLAHVCFARLFFNT